MLLFLELSESERLQDVLKMSTWRGGRNHGIWSAQAVITNYRRPGGLDNKQLFLTVLEAGKSEIEVLANSAPDETHLLACRQPPSQCQQTWTRRHTVVDCVMGDKHPHRVSQIH